jgi:hypothetical protein
MVKNDFGIGTLFGEFELHNRVDAWNPIHYTPRLDNSLVRHKLDLAAYDVATEKCERATRLPADFGVFFPKRHARLHGPTELNDFVKLSDVRERLIDTLTARLKHGLLMNGFRRMGNAVLGPSPNPERDGTIASKRNRGSDQLPSSRRIGRQRQPVLKVHGCIELQIKNMIKIIF